MSNLENGFSLRQLDSLNGFTQYAQESKDKDRTAIYLRLLSLDSESLQILKAVGETSGIGSRSLEDKVNLTRAPILARTKKLSETELLARGISPGTENRSKPAYTYSLPLSVSLLAIDCAIAKMDLDKYLELENRKGTPISDEIPLGSSESTSPGIEKGLGALLGAALKRIALLEDRLLKVEGLLQGLGLSSLDLDELFKTLDS